MSQPFLTLRSVSMTPEAITSAIVLPWGGGGVLRPLDSGDQPRLQQFYESLSHETRRFYSVPTDLASHAAEHSVAIFAHDKLRLVLIEADVVIGLVEFSFDLVPADIARYRAYGVRLNPGTDCRFGLCVTTSRQGQGLGSMLFGPAMAVASRFGQERVILWGGVHAANARALRYYRRCGFTEVGRFLNDDGVRCVDMFANVQPRSFTSSVTEV